MAIITGSGGGGGSGTVTTVSSANNSITVANATTTPTLTVGSVDKLFTNNAPAADLAMGSHKITGLTNGSAASDAAAFGQITAANASAIPTDGWTASSDTWTYASATTFTIAGVDRTSTFTVGTKLKLTQTTAKYFVVVSSAFSTDTTVTVTGGADYSLANAAITSPFYSYVNNPRGYPDWFTFTPQATGFSATSTLVGYFRVSGRECTYLYNCVGTSNATTFTLTLPIAAAAATNGVPPIMGPAGQIENNGVVQAGNGLAFVASGGGTTVAFFPDGTAGSWASSNAKYAIGQVKYPI